CNDASDCMAPLVCDSTTHQCTGCTQDGDCALGSICISGACVPGCSATHDCQNGFSCCGSQCFDLQTDEDHCGDCAVASTPPANAQALCQGGHCTLGPCSPNFADCNLDPSDGCEQNVLQDGPCACAPGATQSCYEGAPGTVNVGPCKAGTQTCDAT